MTSQSEVGHAKNLANLKLLKDCIVQIGSIYNPINTQLTASAVATLVTASQTAYNNWVTKLTFYKDESNKREIAFEPLNKLVTTVNQSVQQLNEPQQTFDDVQSIVKKIHGDTTKIKKNQTAKVAGSGTIPNIPDPATPLSDPISTSQQSYDSLITNFDKLIKRLQTIPTYTPNENELKITTLQTLFTNLNTLNTNAGNADFALSLARNQRNLVFYAPQTGMYDITKKIKKYIRSNKAISLAIYSEITKLKFVKIVQKKKKKNN